MTTIQADDSRAILLTRAIQAGDVATVRQALRDSPELAVARIVDSRGVARTLLHVATDWPGQVPNGPALVAALVAAGADVNAPLAWSGPDGSPETPLHWAACSGDVDILDALLDHGADIEAPGAVFTGGSPMSDAVIFAQWSAAERLHARGATTTLWQAAALGLRDRVEQLSVTPPLPTGEQLTNAFWHACRGGQRATAEVLLDRGADVNWVGHDRKTPLDAARDRGDAELVRWLVGQGARGDDPADFRLP